MESLASTRKLASAAITTALSSKGLIFRMVVAVDHNETTAASVSMAFSFGQSVAEPI